MNGLGDGPKIVFEIGPLIFTETVVMGWLIIAVVTLLCLWLTKDLKKKPESKRQIVAEMFVNFVNGMVKQSMGEKMMYYAPYIGALLVSAVLGALISMVGLRSMTADINVTAAWAIVTFVLITYTKIKTNGFLGYLKSFAQPVAFILPLNLISEIATPASMAFRLFGNVAGGMVITGLLYSALGAASTALHLHFEFASWAFSVLQVGIPAVLSIYFDLFSGCIQAYIFSTLTMVNVAAAAEE
ncbi:MULTISPECIES: F0F1 ATP synthase subunit A [Ruminococcus]|uniref:ATP synthase subunit a n=1 Tax=Ruminococcus albus (strain ATCC 27210 / DSM 20455 / JCM 14654 / NCDO 2250 / 7) TaxID=697329 RepID=E6UDM6_RUMA7|nr:MULTISPECIES: FoF1 ATP synthase subunit a [Ruminococcus]ADU20854.1 ATP synthase F0, A subunit [Ruminococcus albus 7 = DSM 20455]MCR5022458.1 F0F1 ATP synthase subunit A [Ruminococcus sp.]